MLLERRNERWLFGAAAALLCVEVVFLFAQLHLIVLPWRWLRPADARLSVGRVISKKNRLQERAASSLTWYPVAHNDPIQLNDTLMTGPDSSAHLWMQGDGEIELGPETLIHFSETRQHLVDSSLRLEMQEGEATVKTKSEPITLQVAKQKVQIQADSEV